MNFKILLVYDKDYEDYVVDVPELKDCISQGKTLDEAINNIKDAIKGWLIVEEKLGRTYQKIDTDIFLGEVSVV